MGKGRMDNLLSMAQRAGKVVSGDLAVQKALTAGQARLLILATDASDDTRKKYGNLARQQKVKVVEGLTKDALGHCLGKEYRAVAALLDRGFSEALEKRIQSER